MMSDRPKRFLVLAADRPSLEITLFLPVYCRKDLQIRLDEIDDV